ncbi:MAG TPA: HD domain-containing phosphohydrolase, partial [Longimicrobiales bacterium]|nr:HD domain-containing phosphohydrolase [Longimicrobiales bacterium]
MKSATSFLNALAHALSTMGLYSGGHPALERAVDRAYQALSDLQDERPAPRFTFLGGEVLLEDRPIRELQHWAWGARLAGAGVQRVELLDRVSREDFDAFLEEVHERLGDAPMASATVRQARPSNIRYGGVGIRGAGGVEELEGSIPTATLSYSLREEMELVEWLHGEVEEGRGLKLLEAEGIVRSLSVAMHGDQAYFIPLLRLKEFDQYTVTHSLNVAVLTMALSEFLGLGPKEVRAFGIAGLLHDLGKVRVPDEILNKPGRLTEEEREVINRHTTEGARIILETEQHLDMAAVVAYEHHIRIDGGGYPALRFARKCHQASNLVHVCDVFDALRTHRPY